MLFGTGTGVRIALHRALWPSEGAGKLTNAGADGAHLPSVARPLCAAGSSGLEILSSRFGLVSVCGDVCRRYMYRECPRREGGCLQA
jgi:hypothetical protein